MLYEVITEQALEPVADLEAVPAVAHGEREEQAVVLPRLPEAPAVVGDVEGELLDSYNFV